MRDENKCCIKDGGDMYVQTATVLDYVWLYILWVSGTAEHNFVGQSLYLQLEHIVTLYYYCSSFLGVAHGRKYKHY
jgi:hypothetical protein